jgi:hypothetical protein
MLYLVLLRKEALVSIEFLPDWMVSLDDEDMKFIRNFIIASGSLKEIAVLYGITYPTVRLRLDRIIQKVNIGESSNQDPFISKIKQLALNDKLDFETAKVIITEYKNAQKEQN